MNHTYAMTNEFNSKVLSPQDHKLNAKYLSIVNHLVLNTSCIIQGTKKTPSDRKASLQFALC